MIKTVASLRSLVPQQLFFETADIWKICTEETLEEIRHWWT